MQPNFLLTGQVYPMLMSSAPQEWGTLVRKSTLFKLVVKLFLNGFVFMFWHNIMYIEFFHCVTNFELVWTWNKVAVVENVKKCRLHPTFTSFIFSVESRCQRELKSSMLGFEQSTSKSSSSYRRHVALSIIFVPNEKPAVLWLKK